MDIHTFVWELLKDSKKQIAFDEAEYEDLKYNFIDHFEKKIAPFLKLAVENNSNGVNVTLPENVAPHKTNIHIMSSALEEVFSGTDLEVKVSRNPDCSIRVDFSWKSR